MKWFSRKKDKEEKKKEIEMIEVPHGGLYKFEDFQQVIKAIADIKLMQAELMNQGRHIEAIEHSAANVSKLTDFQIKVNGQLDEIQKHIDELTNDKVSQGRSIDLIWAQLGRVKGHATELEDVITGEDTQLRKSDYDEVPFH